MRRISRHCWTKKFHLYRFFRAKPNQASGKDISKDNKHERRPGTDGLVRVLFFTRVRHATTFKFGKFHFDAEISSTLRPKLVLLELWLSQSWNSTISASFEVKNLCNEEKTMNGIREHMISETEARQINFFVEFFLLSKGFASYNDLLCFGFDSSCSRLVYIGKRDKQKIPSSFLVAKRTECLH